jgi:hypothetical protein
MAVHAQERTESQQFENWRYLLDGLAVAAADDLAVATTLGSVLVYQEYIEDDWAEVATVVPIDCGDAPCSGVLGNTVALAPHEVSGYRIAMLGKDDNSGSPLLALLTYSGDADFWEPESLVDKYDVYVRAIAMHGDVIVVALAAGPGSLYTYRRVGGGWQSEARIDGPWTATGAIPDALSFDGDRLVVGVPADGGDGSVHVYDLTRRRDGSLRFAYDAVLTPSDGTGDYFGFGTSVATDGTAIVVGAPFAPGQTANSGAAYVFRDDSSQGWREEARLTSNDGEPADAFGWQVGIDGNVIAVSAFGDDGYAGAAYVFGRVISRRWPSRSPRWVQGDRLIASDRWDMHQLGFALAITGDAVIAGAPSKPGYGTHEGAVYLFECVVTTGGC